MTDRAWRSRLIALLVLAGPAFLLLAVMRLVPIGQALALAFTRWNGVGEPEWIGTLNFRYALEDPTLRAAVVNSLLVVASLPLWVVAPLFVAGLLHSARIPARRFFRFVVFLPSVLSPVVIGSYVNVLLRHDGPVNRLLDSLGLHRFTREWLYSESTALPVVIGVLVWAALGVGTLVFLAALSAVDINLYEAARIDGASWLRTWWHVTVPQVRPTVAYWSVIVLTSMFTALFPFIYTLTRGGPGTATYVVEYYVYDRAFFAQAFGYASAVGVFLLVVVLMIATAQVAVLRRAQP